MNKTASAAAAVSLITEGTTVMVGGFGVPGTPFALIDRLLAQGTQHLVLIKNEANIAGMGVSKLIEAGRVDHLITSHLGLNPAALDLMNSGRITVEFNPQGILAERIRPARGCGPDSRKLR